MKIALRGMGSAELMERLEESGVTELVGGLKNGLFFESSWPDSRLDEFLRDAAQHGALDLNPWMTFSRAEVERADFLQLRPRKVVGDSAADFERMRSELDDLPWMGDDPKRRFRLPERVFLSRIRLQPGQVAVVGQWSAEYVVPQRVRELCEGADFSGVEFRNLLHTRSGEPFDGYFHLYTDHILGPRVLDVASPEIHSAHPEEQGYDVMGCLCYDRSTLGDALDFNRTGENIVSFEFPDWIVRSRVREWFLEHGLKGWTFEPVLQAGTPTFQQYDELWRSLRHLLGDCKQHTVRSRSFGVA